MTTAGSLSQRRRRRARRRSRPVPTCQRCARRFCRPTSSGRTVRGADHGLQRDDDHDRRKNRTRQPQYRDARVNGRCENRHGEWRGEGQREGGVDLDEPGAPLERAVDERRQLHDEVERREGQERDRHPQRRHVTDQSPAKPADRPGDQRDDCAGRREERTDGTQVHRRGLRVTHRQRDREHARREDEQRTQDELLAAR